MNIAEELKPVAEQTAHIVGQQKIPGEWIVIIQGEIDENMVSTIRWQWFFHPPTELVPSSPVDLKS